MYISSVAVHRTRKNKEHPHYNFLYSWTPSEPGVKRETNFKINTHSSKLSASKKAEIQAKDNSIRRIKKDIIRSLALVGLMLAAEVVVYLARFKFSLP
jgi:hypothetical protein